MGLPDTGAPDDALQLCERCGLCCDGTLFDRVYFKSAEADSLTDLGFTVRDFGEELGFAQPCVHLDGALCRVYPARPHACRTYRCETLVALEAGAITALVAGARVAATRRAADRVRRLAPSDIAPCALDARLGATASPPLRRALAALDARLDRHFRKAHQRRTSAVGG